MLSTFRKLSLVILITVHSSLLVPVGEYKHSFSEPLNSTGWVNTIGNATKRFQELENDRNKSEEILPFRMKYLTPDLIEKARNELNETEEVKEKALAELKELIAAEKNLVARLDEVFLLAFLRVKKFNVKKAFENIQNFYKFFKQYEHIFNNPKTDAVIRALNYSLIGFLEYRDRNGSSVLIIKTGLWDPEEIPIDVVLRATTNLFAFSLEYEATQIAGLRIIHDLRGLSWKHLKQCTPENLYLLIYPMQFDFPTIIKGIHVVSNNTIMKIGWQLAYPFMPQETKEKVFFHKDEDFKLLSELISPSVLPEEYGGNAPRFDNTPMLPDMENMIRKAVAYLEFGYKD